MNPQEITALFDRLRDTVHEIIGRQLATPDELVRYVRAYARGEQP